MRRTILSLFDYSGVWSSPYRDAGYKVIQIDLKLGDDVLTYKPPRSVHGVLAAPPCTDFSVSGAQYWPQKDRDGRTDASVDLIYATMRIINYCRPVWWALENPVGRLNKLVPDLVPYGPWYFQPHWFGDAYTKKTGLWGTFARQLPRTPVDPIRVSSQGSWLMRLGGKSDRTKELRSITPPGFAAAFFVANP